MSISPKSIPKPYCRMDAHEELTQVDEVGNGCLPEVKLALVR